MNQFKTYILDPPLQGTEQNRIRRREISEMLGICRGIIVDGLVSAAEVEFLKNWLCTHPQAAGAFPGSVIAARLNRIYADGVVSDEERADLFSLLQDVTGQETTADTTVPTTLHSIIPRL